MSGMWVWWTLALVAFAVLCRCLSSSSGRKRSRGGENPQEILKRRYASGEIDRETFERMRRDLGE